MRFIDGLRDTGLFLESPFIHEGGAVFRKSQLRLQWTNWNQEAVVLLVLAVFMSSIRVVSDCTL